MMLHPRHDERQALAELWQVCFPEDTPEETQDFFGALWHPRWCLVAREQDRIIAMLHIAPYVMRVPKPVQAWCLSGVGTHPDFRGRGLASGLVRQALAWARQQRVPLVTLTTDKPWAYTSSGFVPVGDTGAGLTTGPSEGPYRIRRYTRPVAAVMDGLQGVFDVFGQGLRLYTLRDRDAWRRWARLMTCYGAAWYLAYDKEGALCAYAAAQEAASGSVMYELCWTHPGAARQLMAHLPGRELILPRARLTQLGLAHTARPRMMARCTYVPGLCMALRPEAPAQADLTVTDRVLGDASYRLHSDGRALRALPRRTSVPGPDSPAPPPAATLDTAALTAALLGQPGLWPAPLEALRAVLPAADCFAFEFM